MKRTDLKKHIKENNLLTHVEAKPGIYAIEIDDFVVYVGQSKNMRNRCETHIYNMENATFINEQKYLLLLSAKLGGHKIDCISLEYVPEEKLRSREQFWINQFSPILNINIGGGRQDISKLKIEDVLNHIKQKREQTLKYLLSEGDSANE